MKDRINTGTLSNGLVYGVRETDLDAEEVQLCLVLKTGSLQQREDENGIAHIVEHMNMNFDKYSYYKQCLEYTSYGLTDFDRTVYVFSCSNHEDSIRQCLFILRQIAEGIYIRSEFLEAIKQDIAAEIHSRSQAGKSETEQTIFEHAFYQSRIPAGDAESVRHTSHTQVTAFHKRWYKPDRMAVFVVGAVNHTEIQREIIAIFSELFCADKSHKDSRDTGMPAEYPSPQSQRLTKQLFTVGDMNLLEIYMKHTDQVEVTLKSDLLRNILVEQLDTVCSEALRSVGCPVDFFAAMFINFINLQQFCKFRVVYRGVQSPHQIIEVINTAICSLVNDPNIGCMVEKNKKKYADYYSSCEFHSSLDVHGLLEECVEHFILGSPLLSYELDMQQITDTLNSIGYAEVRQAAELLLNIQATALVGREEDMR
ncbi:insulinase family protein [Paenibacillus phytohabitans]|uniref:insulinase family protein n=1 Tax=Paenibacillus phytohabitans TaxID=2654978 RepID=UPI00300A396B